MVPGPPAWPPVFQEAGPTPGPFPSPYGGSAAEEPETAFDVVVRGRRIEGSGKRGWSGDEPRDEKGPERRVGGGARSFLVSSSTAPGEPTTGVCHPGSRTAPRPAPVGGNTRAPASASDTRSSATRGARPAEGAHPLLPDANPGTPARTPEGEPNPVNRTRTRKTAPSPSPDPDPNERSARCDHARETSEVACRVARGSASPASQPLGIENQHALALESEPTTVCEVGEGLVHGLP